VQQRPASSAVSRQPRRARPRGKTGPGGDDLESGNQSGLVLGVGDKAPRRGDEPEFVEGRPVRHQPRKKDAEGSARSADGAIRPALPAAGLPGRPGRPGRYCLSPIPGGSGR